MVRERTLGHGKKTSQSANDVWHDTYTHIHKVIPKSHIEILVNKTVRQIIRLTRGRNAALCWSGGKDSILIEKLCNMAGTIKNGVWVTAEPLEFPSFYQWCESNKPDYVTTLDRGFGLEWLKANPDMYFPDPNSPNIAKIKTKWDTIFQRRGQEQYFKAHPEITMKITGRRKVDGNFVGNGTNHYKMKSGLIVFNPVADWTHEEMLAFFYYYKVELPPLYTKRFPEGWTIGTILWANLLLRGDEVNTYKYIHQIEPEILKNAAEYFESAKIALEQIGRGDIYEIH